MASTYDLDDPGEELPESIRNAFRAALPRDLARLRAAFDTQSPSEVFRAAHDIKGQAPVFGYGLVGAIALAIADLTRNRHAFDAPRAASVRAHIEALETVIGNDIGGGGGDLGRSLIAELEITRRGL